MLDIIWIFKDGFIVTNYGTVKPSALALISHQDQVMPRTHVDEGWFNNSMNKVEFEPERWRWRPAGQVLNGRNCLSKRQRNVSFMVFLSGALGPCWLLAAVHMFTPCGLLWVAGGGLVPRAESPVFRHSWYCVISRCVTWFTTQSFVWLKLLDVRYSSQSLDSGFMFGKFCNNLFRSLESVGEEVWGKSPWSKYFSRYDIVFTELRDNISR